MRSATRRFTIWSDTSPPDCRIPSTSCPKASFRAIRSRSMSPVEICGTPNASRNKFACVPLPEPGAPNMIRHIRLIDGTAASNAASSSADPARAGGEALVMPHDQLGLDLVHGIHGHTHHDQQAGTTKVKIHAQAIQQPAREGSIDPV